MMQQNLHLRDQVPMTESSSATPHRSTASELLRPSRIVVHVLVGLATVAMICLGIWQLRVALPERAVASATTPAVPLNDVSTFGDFLAPSAIGVRVMVAGRFDMSKQLLATVTTQANSSVVSTRYALIAPLLLDDGTTMAVLLGGVGSATDTSATAPNESRTVTVTGPITNESLGLTIPSGGDASGTARARQLTTDALVAAWKVNLRDGVVVRAEQQPPGIDRSLTPSNTAVVTRTIDSGVQWRNALYAVQWWIFAVFTVFIYVRYLTDSLRESEILSEDL